ncbi:MAG: hypothetical protein AB1473_09030 [Thermodesulfobacteriota bacterium]
MRCVRLLLMVLIAVALLVLPNPGRTDRAPLVVLSGGATLKSAHHHIRMDSQEVTIRLKKTTYEVDAVYHFFNTGEATTEWVGFPKRGDHSKFLRFDMWVDGRNVDVSEQRDLSPDNGSTSGHIESRDSWLVHYVTFPGRSRTTIRDSYEVQHYWDNSNPRRKAIYEHGTGSYWKDAIGLAAFTIDASEIGGTKFFNVGGLPPAARRLATENVLRYEIRNFNPAPTDRLEITFDSGKLMP